MSDEAPAPAPDDAVSFLRGLNPGGPWRLTFKPTGTLPPWWRNRKDGTPWATLTRIARTDEDIQKFVADGALYQLNCYYTANRSKVADARKLKKHEISQLVYLHVDLDPRAFDSTGRTPEERDAHFAAELARLEQQALAYKHRPTAVVFSGGGLNILFKAAVPVDVECTEEDKSVAEEAERWGRQLQRDFDGADNTHNLDRLLRLPGSINWPDEKKRLRGRVPTLARTLFTDWDATVDLSQMPKAPPLAARGMATTVTVDPKLSRGVPSETIMALGISDRAKVAIVQGRDDENPLKGKNGRSEWVWHVLNELLRAKVDDQLIYDILLDPDFGVSAHCREQTDPSAYVLKQIQDAKAKFVAEPETDGPELGGEDALADKLVADNLDRLRYCNEMSTWLRWTGVIWRPDTTLAVYDMARKFARAAEICSGKIVANAERFAKSDPRIAVTADVFDADLMMLNTPKGIIDLRTGSLLPSNPALYCTKVTRVGQEDGAPRQWLNFLDVITAGDTAMIAFIQRVVGYCLTGMTNEHAMFFAYGEGGNGKSVLTDTVQSLMGDFARTLAFDALTVSSHRAHPTEIAGLRGYRCVMVPETEAGTRWAESKIKMLTGGDMVSARLMRQDYSDFRPQFKLFVNGNHKPSFNNVDVSIRRRVNLLPFKVKIEHPDKGLKERMLAEEGGQILRWMVEGCLEWLRLGLAPPPVVTEATDKYMQEEDAIGRWLAECTTPDVNDKVKVSELFESYDDWCRSGRETMTLGKRLLCDRLEERGYRRKEGTGGVKMMLGLNLTAQEATRMERRQQARRDEEQARVALLEAQGARVLVERPGRKLPF